MKPLRSIVFVAALLAASTAYAQEAPPADNLPQMDVEGRVKEAPAPELTPDERTAFDTVKAMESLASAKALDSKEGRAFLKARVDYEKKVKALQASVQATAEYKAAMAMRQKLDARVKARGAGVINWTSGALTPPPAKQ